MRLPVAGTTPVGSGRSPVCVPVLDYRLQTRSPAANWSSQLPRLSTYPRAQEGLPVAWTTFAARWSAGSRRPSPRRSSRPPMPAAPSSTYQQPRVPPRSSLLRRYARTPLSQAAAPRPPGRCASRATNDQLTPLIRQRARRSTTSATTPPTFERLFGVSLPPLSAGCPAGSSLYERRDPSADAALRVVDRVQAGARDHRVLGGGGTGIVGLTSR